MSPIIIHNSNVPKMFDFLGLRLYGIMLFPFIFVTSRDYITRHESTSRKKLTIENVVNHEKIHYAQCLETLVVGFYIMFIFEYLCNYYQTGNLAKSFINIRFEKEAYKYSHNHHYLSNRIPYSWLYYF